MIRAEIVRAILAVSDYSQKVSDDCHQVEGCAEEMADRILLVLGKV